jgi:hypothetical protein
MGNLKSDILGLLTLFCGPGAVEAKKIMHRFRFCWNTHLQPHLRRREHGEYTI